MVDPEKYPGTHTFVNLLDIRSAKELAAKEADITYVRGIELYQKPSLVLQSFDLPHLKAIHKYLLQDVFEWAGEIRSYDMSRNGDIFTPHQKIEYYAGVISTEIAADNYLKGHDADTICQKLARYLGLLNMLHPFSEGNGRTQRIFLSHLVLGVGYKLNWEAAPQWMIVATAQNVHRSGDYEGMEAMIKRILIPPA